MNRSNQAFIFFVNMLAGWLNRRQQQVIDYVVEENQILRAQLRGKRLRLTNDQRRRLAVKGQNSRTQAPRASGRSGDPGYDPRLAS